jgi:RHS repeat-associated protein
LGALARIELGNQIVQGQDYFYTLNGWLKGMNSSVLIPAFDLGKDGAGGTSTYGLYHSKIPSDIVSYTLGYYKGDYTAISSGLNSLESAYFTNGAAPTENAFSSQSPSLYNGNIRNLTTSIQGFTTLGTSYQYDQLQRLKQATSYEMTSPFTNAWQGIAATQKYFNSYSYDKNGNITNLVRKDQSGALMDQFTYGYGTTSNRLLNVADAAGATSNTDDIEPGQVANNYQYDLLGQLISDNQEGIVNYNWRLSDRKLRSITGAPTKRDVNFIYNPFGQRVVKIVKPKVNGVVDKQSNWIYTYYSYDANGQVMAVYDCKLDATNATLNQATLKEQHLYGSQRLGMVNKNTLLYQSNTAYTAISSLVQNTYGNTNYELTNHLGNVNAVITDRRFWNTTTLKHEAGVEAKNDYYPFGMEMPLRQSGSNDYRYGYNGMEVDNEVFGNGNSYTTEFRQYDPRLGRWKSLDPLMAQFPWQSPYCAFDNNPVFYNDPLGLAAKEGDDWVVVKNPETKVNDVIYNEKVKTDADAKTIYGDNAKRIDYGFKYEDVFGDKYVLHEGGKFEKNGVINEPKNIASSNNGNTGIQNQSNEQSATKTQQNDNVTSTSTATLDNPWNKSGDNQSSGGLDGKDWFEIGLGTVSTFYDIKGNSLHNDLYWKGKTTGKIYTKNPFTSNKIGWKANSFKATGKTFQGAKSLGTKLGIVGMALTGADIIWGDGLTSSNILDATFGAAGFIPGIGWMISGSYFIINTGVQLYSGKSIGEHLDD